MLINPKFIAAVHCTEKNQIVIRTDGFGIYTFSYKTEFNMRQDYEQLSRKLNFLDTYTILYNAENNEN